MARPLKHTSLKTIQFVITPSDKWYVFNYQEDIQVLDDCVLNIAKLLEEEGIVV
jgi:hypothetical protein